MSNEGHHSNKGGVVIMISICAHVPMRPSGEDLCARSVVCEIKGLKRNGSGVMNVLTGITWMASCICLWFDWLFLLAIPLRQYKQNQQTITLSQMHFFILL